MKYTATKGLEGFSHNKLEPLYIALNLSISIAVILLTVYFIS